MPNHSNNWPSQRHHLTQALKHLAKFTDSLQTFLELSDEAEAQVLTLDFGTSSVIAVMDELRAEAIVETNMAKRAKPDDAVHWCRPWTPEDDELLIAGHRLGMSRAQIAERLGRNTSGVKSRYNRLRRNGVV
jgi:DNA-directed RNA polymerase specialized sigma24 family protein